MFLEEKTQAKRSLEAPAVRREVIPPVSIDQIDETAHMVITNDVVAIFGVKAVRFGDFDGWYINRPADGRNMVPVCHLPSTFEEICSRINAERKSGNTRQILGIYLGAAEAVVLATESYLREYHIPEAGQGECGRFFDFPGVVIDNWEEGELTLTARVFEDPETTIHIVYEGDGGVSWRDWARWSN